MAKLNRNQSTNKLIFELKHSGRNIACEVCGELNESVLEVHHIMPFAINQNNLSNNLAVLCVSHHALIEKFYWWERCKLLPEETKELKQIALLFSNRQVNPKDIDSLKERTKFLWVKLNTDNRVQNFFWWSKCFQSAKDWATTQNIFRPMSSGNAIIEEPWFRKIS